MSNKINMIYDGNNFCFKAISVYKGIGGKKLFRLKEEKDQFLKILATNFISEFNRFKEIINKVVVVVDSKSWRYNYYPDYKGKRKRDPNVNWENYTKLVHYFYGILHKYGVIVSRVDGAEGDDLIFAWSDFFFKHGQNSVILSMDRDITQNVRYENGKFVVVYDNTYSKLFAPKNFFNDVNSLPTQSVVKDIFSINDFVNSKEELSDDIRKIFKNLMKTKVLPTIVDVDEFIFKKILVGDKGDNIYSPYIIEKNNKKYGIGEKKSETIMSEYRASNGNFTTDDTIDKNSLMDLAEIIRVNMKLDRTLKDEVYDGLKRNIKLMVLDGKQIPKQLLVDMNKNISKRVDKNINFKHFYNTNVLLEGYVKKDNNTVKGLF